MVAGCLIHRDGFAGQGRFVHSRMAFQYRTVHRDTLAGTNHEHVALLHLGDRDDLFRAVHDDRGRLRRKGHERFDRVSGAAFGAGLQHLAHGDQGKDHRSGLEVELMQIMMYCFWCMQLCMGHAEEHGQAVPKGRCGSQRHQSVHVGRAFHQGFETADEEFLVDDHNDGRQHQLEQGDRQRVLRQDSGQRPAPHHMAHADIHQHQQESQRPDQPLLELRRFVIGQDVISRGGAPLPFHRGAIACLLHGADNGIVRRGAFNAHRVG